MVERERHVVNGKAPTPFHFLLDSSQNHFEIR